MVELSVGQKSHPICSSPNSSLSSNFLSLKLFPAFIYFSKSWMADASNGHMPESKSFESSDEGNPDLTTEQKAKEKKDKNKKTIRKRKTNTSKLKSFKFHQYEDPAGHEKLVHFLFKKKNENTAPCII